MASQKTLLLYSPDWQFNAKLVQANELYVVAPRGTGKTEEILAQRALQCVCAMPRGKGAMVAVSYKKLKTQLLPPLLKTWHKFGFQKGKQFWVGNEPRPKNYKIDLPYIPPIETTDFIQFANGHGIHLISQDRAGMANGLSVDWMGIDEGRLINKERYDEDASAILRGNDALFGHLPLHGSITLTTDMPFTDEGQWILDMEKEMNPELIDTIYQLAVNLEIRYSELEAKPKNKSLQAEIHNLEKMLASLRKEAVHYVEVSDGSNLLFLGKKFVYKQMRVMQRNQFISSILGIRGVRGFDDFYPDFNAGLQGYYSSNHEYLQDLDLSHGNYNDCRTDGDLNDSPVYFAMDHNTAINWAVFGQFHGNEFRVIKSMYVLGRENKKLSDLISDIIDYYWPVKSRSWVYIYDATSTKTDSRSNSTEASEVMDGLRRAGFPIVPHEVGQPFLHEYKFTELRKLHSGNQKIKLSINRDNNEQLIKLLETTKAVVTGGKTQKDKSKEKKIKDFPQEDAPHGTDAYDLLVLGAINKKTSTMTW